MQKIDVEKGIGVYLDHRILINAAYGQRYQIKEQLFAFHEKVVAKEPPESTVVVGPFQNAATQANRKRKRSAKQGVIIEPQDWIKTFLMNVQDVMRCPRDLVPAVIPRYWDEAIEFPQFHGYNDTNEFQTICIAGKSFIIPPLCRFFNSDVLRMSQLLPQLALYDLIVLDPPWRNKYIRRLKRTRPELAYKMLDNLQLSQIPLANLVHTESIVAIWCTNSPHHQQALKDDFLPKWNLRLLHEVKWLKLNTDGRLIGTLYAQGTGNKQPYEMLYLACHRDADANFGTSLKRVKVIAGIPSIIHSHKPTLLSWLCELLPAESKCLEIFARYLQPHFTSIGLEVLKLMDDRLYTTETSELLLRPDHLVT